MVIMIIIQYINDTGYTGLHYINYMLHVLVVPIIQLVCTSYTHNDVTLLITILQNIVT